MKIPKGIPEFELASGNVTQGEFWEFEKDPTCVGLYGQNTPPLSYVERLLLQIERAQNRRSSAKAQVECDAQIFDDTTTQEKLLEKRGVKKKRRNRKSFWAKQMAIFNPFSFKNKETGEPYYQWQDQESPIDPDSVDHFIESMKLLAKLLPTMSLEERLQSDHNFAREFLNGEWDQ
jgi:hypothetical protein